MTPEHKAKIAAALKAYAARPDSHLHAIHKSGVEHPNFKGGSNAHYYRRIAFEAYGTACQKCGSTRNILVHHKDEDRHNSDLSNLEVLCRSCHNRMHGLGGDMRNVTHCPKGHEYSPENTQRYIDKRGYANRSCRTCNRAANRAWYSRQKQVGAAS